MYARIDKSYIDKHAEGARESAVKQFGEEDAGDDLLFEDVEMKSVEAEVEDEKIDFSLDTEMGYISFEWSPDVDELIGIIELAVKKSNKIKTMLEAIK